MTRLKGENPSLETSSCFGPKKSFDTAFNILNVRPYLFLHYSYIISIVCINLVLTLIGIVWWDKIVIVHFSPIYIERRPSFRIIYSCLG